MIELRPYQREALDAIMGYWAEGGGNPLVDMATGCGKSLVLAKLVQDCLTSYPDMRTLVLTHVKELITQDFLALKRLWPDAPAGIYSAGLGRRDAHHRITFASIQSVYRKARQLGRRDLVIVDECHLIPQSGDGMYRTLLDALREECPDARLVGLSATPYRLDSGRLDEGDGRLFDRAVFSYGIRQGIDDGYLSPLTSKAALSKVDVRGVAKRGGEFVPGALEAAFDIDWLTRQAVGELVELGASRRSWLVFCAGVKHAHHVADALRAAGISAVAVSGETPAGERDRAVADFKAGRLRALCNCMLYTTGFDAPGVDLVALLMSTLSTGKFVQIVGRATRLAPGKSDALILDYGGNVRRHGPVDLVEIAPGKSGKKGDGAVKEDAVRAKECPTCHSLAPLNAGVCKDCGHEWPIDVKPKHEAHADAETPILATEEMLSRKARKLLPEEHPVVGWEAKRHVKMGAPDTLKVTYFAGLLSFDEYVCVEHAGFAGHKAARWWRAHGGAEPLPQSVTEALNRMGELTRPDAIQVRKSDRWWDVVGHTFARAEEEAAA